MPAAKEYRPDDKEIREQAGDELKARQKRHERNLRYYTGDHKKYLKASDSYDPNVVLNFSRDAVKKTIAFLCPSFPELDVMQGETEAEDRAIEDTMTAPEDYDELLKYIWAQNDSDVWLINTATHGALDGHVYTRIAMDGNIPRVYTLAGDQCLTFWDSDDRTQVLWHEIYWQTGKVRYRQDVVNDGVQWVIRQFAQGSNNNKWELVEEYVWPFALGPVVQWQHMSNPWGFYGDDEFASAELNDAINKLASDMALIMHYHGHPRTVGTGVEASQITETAVNGFYAIPDPQAKVYNLEMQSDLSAAMNFLEVLTAAFWSNNRVVVLPPDIRQFANVTNLGIRATFQPMLSKIYSLQRTYGRGIAQLSARMLMLVGQEPLLPEVIWPDPLPTNQIEKLQGLERELMLGLTSKRTAAMELGRDYTEEQRMIDEERTLDDINDGFGGGVV